MACESHELIAQVRLRRGSILSFCLAVEVLDESIVSMSITKQTRDIFGPNSPRKLDRHRSETYGCIENRAALSAIRIERRSHP